MRAAGVSFGVCSDSDEEDEDERRRPSGGSRGRKDTDEEGSEILGVSTTTPLRRRDRLVHLPGRLEPLPNTFSALRRAGSPDPSSPSEVGLTM